TSPPPSLPTRRSSDLLRAQVAKRAKAMFVQAKGQEPEKKPLNGAPSREQWDEGAVTRPTHRGNAAEPKGMALAERNVAAQLRERSEEHTSELQSPDHL